MLGNGLQQSQTTTDQVTGMQLEGEFTGMQLEGEFTLGLWNAWAQQLALVGIKPYGRLNGVFWL